jgi:hypothetical protein
METIDALLSLIDSYISTFNNTSLSKVAKYMELSKICSDLNYNFRILLHSPEHTDYLLYLDAVKQMILDSDSTSDTEDTGETSTEDSVG